MARLFVTSREYDFFADIAREVIKDVGGQKIYLYAISRDKTPASAVYGEAVKKVFDQPVELEALVDVPQWETKNESFSPDNEVKLSVYVQARDVIEKGVDIKVGDFFSYGTVFYEIVSANPIKPMHGQIERLDGFVITGLRARSTVIEQSIVHGPTSERFTDSGAVQDLFVQQRGLVTNSLGVTADTRDLQRRGVLDAPISGQREISNRAASSGSASGFYDE